jgi:hypothetical protein
MLPERNLDDNGANFLLGMSTGWARKVANFMGAGMRL